MLRESKVHFEFPDPREDAAQSAHAVALSQTTAEGRTALHIAAEKGHGAVVGHLQGRTHDMCSSEEVHDFAVGDHVLVEGVNRAKKHMKPNPVKGVAGGIVDKDMPIHLSNVALFNPATKKADRVGFKVLDDGRKVRVFKSNGELVSA